MEYESACCVSLRKVTQPSGDVKSGILAACKASFPRGPAHMTTIRLRSYNIQKRNHIVAAIDNSQNGNSRSSSRWTAAEAVAAVAVLVIVVVVVVGVAAVYD